MLLGFFLFILGIIVIATIYNFKKESEWGGSNISLTKKLIVSKRVTKGEMINQPESGAKRPYFIT